MSLVARSRRRMSAIGVISLSRTHVISRHSEPSRVVATPNNSYTLQPGFILYIIFHVRLLIKLHASVYRGSVVYQL